MDNKYDKLFSRGLSTKQISQIYLTYIDDVSGEDIALLDAAHKKAYERALDMEFERCEKIAENGDAVLLG